MNSLKLEAPGIDEMLMTCIDKIWNKYDDDNNGYLDKEETRAFVIESIKGDPELNKMMKQDDESDDDLMDEKHFDHCFKLIDEDMSGVLTKKEML